MLTVPQQLQTLKVPKFFKLNPREYKPDSWEPSEWDLTNANAEKPLPSVMFRRDPQTGKMQSNTNVYRWSDGSVTIAIGDEHFEIMSKPLAPPPNKPYNEVQDAHYYAAAAHLTTNSLLIVGHFTEEYTVKPNKDIADHALERLKAQMAGAKKERTDEMIIVTKEDPELAKKQAELAEKERAKAQRRRETAAARVDGAGGRYKGGALSIGDLEGRRSGPGGSRKRGQGGPRRRPEYDSDDDAAPGARRADNYDMDDGFLVDSEEESEEVEDDEEEEPDYDEDEAPKSKKRKSKASKSDVDDEGDDDFDDDAPAQASRHKRRIIDDDDEE